MPIPPIRHALWQCLEECYGAPQPFKHFEKCIEQLRADGLAAPAEIDELDRHGRRILELIFGESSQAVA